MTVKNALQLKAWFVELARRDLNCKEIAQIMGIDTKKFGALMREILGVYPSIYISRLKRGKA